MWYFLLVDISDYHDGAVFFYDERKKGLNDVRLWCPQVRKQSDQRFEFGRRDP